MGRSRKVDDGGRLQIVEMDSYVDGTQQSTRSARAWCVVREEQRKKSTVCKKEVAWQNVAAREHVLIALSSISENRGGEYEEDVWGKEESGGERVVAKEGGGRCEGRCEGVEGML